MPISWDSKAGRELRKEIVKGIIEQMETEEELSKDIIDLLPSVRYPRMFRVIYGDGSISKDFYNKTRAKEMLTVDLGIQRKRNKL